MNRVTAAATVVAAEAIEVLEQEQVDAPQRPAEGESLPSHAGKYRALWRWLTDAFECIEDLPY